MNVRHQFLFAIAMFLFSGCSKVEISYVDPVPCDAGAMLAGDADPPSMPDSGSPALGSMISAHLVSGGIINSSITSGGTVGYLALKSREDLILHRLRPQFDSVTDASRITGSAGTRYLSNVQVTQVDAGDFRMVMGPVDLNPELGPLATHSGQLLLEGDVFLPANETVVLLINVSHPRPGVEDAPGEFATDVHYYSLTLGYPGWFREGDITIVASGESVRLEEAFPDGALSVFWVRDPNLH